MLKILENKILNPKLQVRFSGIKFLTGKIVLGEMPLRKKNSEQKIFSVLITRILGIELLTKKKIPVPKILEKKNSEPKIAVQKNFKREILD